MNTADFIITSTYQEIAGTEDDRRPVRELRLLYHAGPLPRGQRHRRVRSQVQHRVSRRRSRRVFSLDADRTAGWSGPTRRATNARPRGRRGRPPGPTRGDGANPLLLPWRDSTASRISPDWWTGTVARHVCETWRTCSSSAGISTPAASNDHEEREQIQRMHELIDLHRPRAEPALARVSERSGTLVGELYRFVADHRGHFLPAGAVRGLRPYRDRGDELGAAGLRDLARGPQRDSRARGVGLPHRPVPRGAGRQPHGGPVRALGRRRPKRGTSSAVRRWRGSSPATPGNATPSG